MPPLSSLLSLVTFVAIVGTSPISTTTPVSITFFFESLCPGCRSFLPNKLYPTLVDTTFDFGSLISNITLVPYGHVIVVNPSAHQYTCQHGPAECEGNRLIACAIKYITDVKISLGYIACLDEKADVIGDQYPVNLCQEKIPEGLKSQINTCYNSDEGWHLFANNGAITEKFFGKESFFVPYVSFNNKKDDTAATLALYNFRKVLCSQARVKDAACTDPEEYMSYLQKTFYSN